GAHIIAIVGQGPVGLSATQLAAAMGARVVALDVSAERLARAKEFGADAVVNPKADDPAAAIKALTRGVGVDLALDTSGAPEGRLTAVRATRPWGTVCFVGEGGGVTLDVSRDLLRKTAHDHRLVDIFKNRAGRMRKLRRRPKDCGRPPVHPPLAIGASG